MTTFKKLDIPQAKDIERAFSNKDVNPFSDWQGVQGVPPKKQNESPNWTVFLQSEEFEGKKLSFLPNGHVQQ